MSSSVTGLAQLGVDHPAQGFENGFARGLHDSEPSNGAVIRRAYDVRSDVAADGSLTLSG